MADEECDVLVLKLLLEAMDLPLFPNVRVGVDKADTQELLCCATEKLMVLLRGEKGARCHHAGEIAS